MSVKLIERIRFATISEGRAAISSSDIYSRNLSAFDLRAKIRTTRGVTESDYLDNSANYVRPWRVDETDYLSSAIRRAGEMLDGLSIRPALPDIIHLVKTTGWEEGGANGYTRANVIYLNQRSISASLFNHELFHLISRHDEPRRDASYATLGFARTAEIRFESPLRITNPDAPSLAHTVRVEHRGAGIDVAIVLVARREYTGGGFFAYVAKRLFAPATGELLNLAQVSGLNARLGRNTAYNIHQEEVCAVHFDQMLRKVPGLPDQHLIDRLRVALIDPVTAKGSL